MKNIYYLFSFFCLLLITACNDGGDETIYLDSKERNITVTNVNPECGYIGDELTLSGDDFGVSPELVKVFIGANQVEVISCEDKTLVVKVPDGTAAGNISVEILGVTVQTDFLYDVLGVPGVTSITPNFGFVFDEVTFEGHDFGTEQGMIKLKFAGSEDFAPVVSCENGKFVVKVPEDAVSGTPTLTISQNKLNVPEFTVPLHATLTAVTPNAAACGSIVKITGTNFVTDGIKVLFGESEQAKEAEIMVANEKELTVKVPEGIAEGQAKIVVLTKYETVKKYLTLSILPVPTVTALSASEQFVGEKITISGTGLGEVKENIKVMFGEKEAEIVYCEGIQVTVKVPELDSYTNAVTLSLSVLGLNIDLGDKSSFKVKEAPLVKDVTSSNVLSLNKKSESILYVAGDKLVINGSGFGTDKTAVTVTVGGVAAAISEVAANKVTAELPANPSGEVKLKFTGYAQEIIGSTKDFKDISGVSDLTEYILVNYKQPLVGAHEEIKDDWDTPKGWEMNDASQNHTGHGYSGFYKNSKQTNYNKDGVLAMQFGWGWHNAFEEGKIWQKAWLSEGTYTVTLDIPECIIKGSNKMFFVVSQNEIPNVSEVTSASGRHEFTNNGTGQKNFNFTLDKDRLVYIGFVATFNSGRESVGKVKEIMIVKATN